VRFGVIVTRGVGELVDTIVAAEQAGYHAAYVADHPSYGLPDPWTLLAYAAARTDRIRLGTHVVATPLHHPTRLANQVATVDILSGGRAVLGLGTAYTVDDFSPYGWVRGTLAERFGQLAESVEVMRALWTGGPVEFDGRWYTLTGAGPRPLPVQRPGPPVVVGVNAVGPAMAGILPLIDGINTWQLGPPGVAVVRQAAIDSGGAHVEMSADVIYLPGATQDEAEDAARAIATRTAASGRPVRATDWHADGMLWGEPSRIADQVNAFAEVGVAELTIAARSPELVPRFADEVIATL